MPEFTLTVPEKYAGDFRAALVEEIATDAAHIKAERKTLCDQLESRHPHTASTADDYRTATKMLDCTVFLAEQVGLDDDFGPIEVRVDDLETLEHVFGAMARSIVGPKLAEELCGSPMEAAEAERLRELIERLSWAVNQAADLNARWVALREEEAA